MRRLDDFDTYIQNAQQSWHCPGVALSIIKEDEVIYERTFGLRDVEAGLELTPDTRFPVASITKSFTAMSVALLVDEGKLEWDKPMREYMPEFILKDSYATQHMTVRDMLSHRTGLPRHDWAAFRVDITLSELVERMRYLDFSASFREKFQYNNLMYYVIAYLIEKVSGQDWESFVQKRIFEPLSMTASNFAPEPPQKGQLSAKGYRADRNENGDVTDLTETGFGRYTKLSPGSAGAIFSTLNDLTTWLRVHINSGKANGVQIVSPETLKQMHVPQTIVPSNGTMESLFDNTIFAYGMGWRITPYKGYTLVHHGGNLEGYSLKIGFVPEQSLGVISLVNLSSSPFRDVPIYEGVDRALELSGQDWNTKYHTIFDPLIASEAKAKTTATQERIEEAAHTCPIEAYTGAYHVDGYPDFEVRLENGELQANAGDVFGGWTDLRQYHYNTFEWHWASFDVWVKVRFLLNDSGELDAISIPIEPAIDNLIYKRKALELPSDFIDNLIGTYDPGIEGVTYSVSVRQDKLYITQTGATAQELKAYELSETRAAFKMNQDRVEFTRNAENITSLAIKTPFSTLEARRIS